MDLKAVVIGVVTDIFLSLFFSLILAVMVTANQVDYQVLSQSTPFILVYMLIGLLCTSIGGYVTAHLAKDSLIKNTLYFGTASLLMSILLSIPSLIFTWTSLLGLGLTIPFALFGGFLEKRTREGTENNPAGERNGD